LIQAPETSPEPGLLKWCKIYQIPVYDDSATVVIWATYQDPLIPDVHDIELVQEQGFPAALTHPVDGYITFSQEYPLERTIG